MKRKEVEEILSCIQQVVCKLYGKKTYKTITKGLKLAVELCRERNINFDVAKNYECDLSQVLCITEKYDDAVPLLKEVINNEEENKQQDNDILLRAYGMYSLCMNKTGDVFRSLYYQRKFLSLAKSLT